VANLIVSAVSTFDNKGLKKGQKEIGSFEKRVKSFAKVFAAAFSARALLNYSKKAVAAFAADEKAAKSLEQQLINTGYQFSSPAVENYIANLQKTTGVLDDQLRPAFQQLLTVTGSITTSQDALNTALNISAGTGKSLTAVSTALSRAYAGNTTGLSRLGAGLDKALLATGDMDKIMGELNKKFAGQSAARLTTYAGKMDLLAVASADAQEIIGKGLVDAIATLADNQDLTKFNDQLTDTAENIADIVRGLGEVAAGIKYLTNLPGIKQLLSIGFETSLLGVLARLGRENTPQQDRGGQERTAGRINAQQRKIEAEIIKKAALARKAELDALKKKNAVDLLAEKFDVERIGFTKALNEATDSETKLRIKAQIAILDNNEALAKKILEEMKAAEAAKKLAEAADSARAAFDRLAVWNPLSGLRATEADILATIGAAVSGLAGRTSMPRSSGGTIFPPAITPYDPLSSLSATTQDLAATGFRYDPLSGMRVTEQDIKITIDTAQTGDRFAQLIAESIQVAGRSGYSTTANGSL
jgi:hypothetical protein